MVTRQMGIYIGKENLILGIDPGRDKTGFSFIDFNGDLILSGIFPSSEREKFFDALINEKDFSEFVIEKKSQLSGKFNLIALGNGTRSKEFYEYLRKKFQCEIKLTDEKNTTLEARKLYWKIHKPNLFQRFLPEGLRVPKRNLDDLAAWAISLRALQNIEL